MATLTTERSTLYIDDSEFEDVPLLANAIVFQGGIVCLDASGWGTKGAVATTLKAVGIAQYNCDNTGGANGAKYVRVRKGKHVMVNSGDVTRANIGAPCYIVDDQTVAMSTGTGTRSIAGNVADATATGVVVVFKPY